ncbi:Bacterial extracellular solute-binding protein domain protein [Cellvibrio japonicus Ueda107]|uniref:Bacterial extracellular solute-binding protein domain protein n=2 Tax=Cellvibrio japonicus TaxID=155077 RepID=B3PD36_CELJU|nr:Bacterial extracellular solute-binding protein domain protein [Cellvibrio japonicus Ueda107]
MKYLARLPMSFPKRLLGFLMLGVCLGCSSATTHASDELTIIYTYAKDHFARVLNEFGKAEKTAVSLEFKEQNDLKSSLMGMVETNNTPDVIIMPADHVGLYAFIKYSEINPKDFTAQIPERIWGSSYCDGKIYGAPLIQGNHLMLFYNKNLVTEPAADWNTMFAQKAELAKKGIDTIAWSFDESYWFLPFLGAYGGWPLNNGKVELNTPAMAAALDFYKSLRARDLPYPNCSYQCAVDLFKTGKVAYTINGDWVGKEFHDALGDNLGVSAIPMAEGKKMQPTFSTHVIAFPNHGLTGPKRDLLIKLANYLQSPDVQKRLWALSGAIPVENSAFEYARQHAQGYLKKTIELMADTKPLPADKEMTFIWDAIGKGYLRHREGALDGAAAARYMQQLAERHIRNAQRMSQRESAAQTGTPP